MENLCAIQPLDVVFLCQRVPHPPDRGDRITTHHFLRHLRQRGCRIRVGCFRESGDDDAGAAAVGQWAEELCAPRIDRRWRRIAALRGLLGRQPLTLPFFASRELSAAVARWVEQRCPDLLWVYSSGMAQHALPHDRVPVRLMQFAELDSDKWRQLAARAGPPGRWIYRREHRLLLEHERTVAHRFTISTVVSEVERDLFVRAIPGVEPLVLPNGVDVDHFPVGDDAQRHPHTVIFTGVMDYEPNVDGVLWFAAECWPRVRSRIADARLLVVGSRPTAAVRAWHGRDGIEVTGRVPEVPPLLGRAAVAVAPLRLARGVQNKVLEAMSTGLPVVASDAAAQGLGDEAAAGGALAVVPAQPERFAAAVIELLTDRDGARAMGARAAAHVRRRFRWDNMFAIADRAIDEALAREKPVPR